MDVNKADQQLINDLIDFLNDHGFIGFSGTFRSKEGFTTLHMEHPLHQDGACFRLAEMIEKQLDDWGAASLCKHVGYVVDRRKEQKNPPHREAGG